MAELAAEGGRRNLIAECRWWKSPVGLNVLEELRGKAELLPADLRERPQLALFSLSGFTEALRVAAAEEGVILVSGADLLEAYGVARPRA